MKERQNRDNKDMERQEKARVKLMNTPVQYGNASAKQANDMFARSMSFVALQYCDLTPPIKAKAAAMEKESRVKARNETKCVCAWVSCRHACTCMCAQPTYIQHNTLYSA